MTRPWPGRADFGHRLSAVLFALVIGAVALAQPQHIARHAA
ncbi:hypothetical protein ACFY6U_02625 [Streptomyces sp. NPDC013157]